MKNTNGFSLVELSIVLVILGLLTGGILAGKSLIRAAELRSVSTDFARYKAATMAFRDKYLEIPGDFSMATRFWTAAASCAATTTTTTCNGSGNGVIDAGTLYEGARYWQHLAMAGLIEGAYNGQHGTVAGTNYPRARINNGMYAFPYDDAGNTGGAWTGGPAYLGGLITPTTWRAQRPFLSMGKGAKDIGGGSNATPIPAGYGVLRVEEAWNIDKKMDDGMPLTGLIHAALTDTGGNYVTTADWDNPNGTLELYECANGPNETYALGTTYVDSGLLGCLVAYDIFR